MDNTCAYDPALTAGAKPVRYLFLAGNITANGKHLPMSGPLMPEERHTIAAICLLGQPVGFSREDIEALDDAICAIHGPKMDGLHPGVEQMLDDLRERIKALLPPE